MKIFLEIFAAEGDTFKSLDEHLAESIRSSGSYPSGVSIKIFMGFDSKPFGYNSRYFSRCINLEL